MFLVLLEIMQINGLQFLPHSGKQMPFKYHLVSFFSSSHLDVGMVMYRERVTDFSISAKRVEFALGEAICESLGLERDYIKKKLLSNHEQKVAMNFYPARKQEDSELTCVLRDHTDPTIITILSEQNVHGLQILHDGEWMNVNLSPNHLIVLTGDLLQVSLCYLLIS